MKKWGFGCFFTVFFALLPLFGHLPAMAEGQALPVVSHGLEVLAAQTDVAVSAPVGNEIVFSADVFARGLNLSGVRYLTLLSLPPEADGSLTLGSTRVAKGQVISGENLSYLTFTPSSPRVAQTSFLFAANGGSIPMLCRLYCLPGVNSSPSVSIAPTLSLNVSTYRGLSAYGTLSAYDPDGDPLTFEIVSYPKNGFLRLTDRELGTYVYQPKEGYVGNDRFSYVARDLYGNYSASAEVSLRVAVSGTSVTYEDLRSSEAAVAALSVTDAGIMSGTRVGSLWYFYPEKTVTRADFLVMAMNAAGVTDVPERTQTVFADDGEIPASMKGYVAAAYSLGKIGGRETGAGLLFEPNATITRAEAAVLVCNLIDLHVSGVVTVFADESEIPDWARDAVRTLHAAGILPGNGNRIDANSPITRGEAARIFDAISRYE